MFITKLLQQLIYLLVFHTTIIVTINLQPKVKFSPFKLLRRRFSNSPLNVQIPIDNLPKYQQNFDHNIMSTPVITYYPLNSNENQRKSKLIFIPITGLSGFSQSQTPSSLPPRPSLLSPPMVLMKTIDMVSKKWPKYYVPKGFVKNYQLYEPYRSDINHKIDLETKGRKFFGQPVNKRSCKYDYFDRERTPEEIESAENYPFYMVNAYIADWVTRFNKFEYDYALKPELRTRKTTKALRTILNAVV